MFKRANKITSLLVAAAAVASMVPAYAADVKKVDSQDGTVYNAVAYNGKFYVDADINDSEAAYYLADGKYNAISDVDSGSDVTAYGTKYADINGGDYFVDLTTGKSTDESIADNAKDDAASNLRKKIKSDTDGRYMKDNQGAAADVLQNFVASNEIPGSKFGEVWYSTSFDNKNDTNALVGNRDGKLNVFTDGTGNYVDADYNVGKIKVTTTTGTAVKSVYIENTNDTYDTANGYKVSASVAPKSVTVAGTTRTDGVIGQDKDYVYRIATVTITLTGTGAAPTITDIDGKTVSGTVFGSSSFTAIQKISKAQASGDIDGAKYAKTVSTYALCDSDGKTYVGTSKAGFDAYTNYSVSNGKVIAYTTDSTNKNVKIETGTLKSENGLYYVDLGSSSTDDTEVKDSTNAVDVDVDGNVYRLNGGYIYQWNNDEDWDKIYKVDGSFDRLSVYDKNNIVSWNQSDEVYAVIGGKTADTKKDDAATTTTPATTTVAKGWAKAADGTWAYNKADGTKATGWLQDGAWYYLNANGVMATGWANVGGTWYYLNASGAMQTGWVNDNGTWYYLNASGAMLANTTVDGYVLGANGAWVK